MKPALTVPSVSTMPGLNVLTRIFLDPSSRESTPVIASTAPFVPVYTELFGRRDAADGGADIDDARPFAQVLDGCLRGQQQAEHIDVEELVE